ncbi:Mur ligase family protein [Clostridium sp. SYSU_GA19001]|uniref:Mur ligase family protein n=1 Tax=Clostridium caldaquaticum TaxID=2940653 RepID=UPI00207765BE|nr:Mur ligase family protein [Clostridium caldaquaticum]MCM8710689.1 Mur ligase family protein [Clostridium caldaquaticum]
MKIISLRVYEGNNMKRKKKIINISIENACDADIKKYLKNYFRVSFLLGFKEQFVDMEKEGKLYSLWVTYTQEEVSKYILYNISYDIDNTEKIVEKADSLVKRGFLQDIIIASQNRCLPVIEIKEDLFQLGYGESSVILGKEFQSYENMIKVEISRNRKNLWKYLRYTHIPKVDGKVLYGIEEIKEIKNFKYPINLRSIDKKADIKITISDEEELNRVLDNVMKMYTRVFVYSGVVKYRIICYKGEAGVILKKENGYKVIEISDRSLEILEVVETLQKLKDFCKRIYSSICIEFMYIDVQEDDGLKAVDLGCVFDVAEELKDTKDKVIDYFINSLIKEGVGLIPIFSVTGTNGKTITCRLINHILKNLGFKTGLASAGFLSAREILSDKEVEAAVVEIDGASIYKEGLGYENAKAVIITSVSEDYISTERVNNLNDLINIKTVVLDELDKGGKIIIKAQKELMEYVINKENVCLYNVDKNELIIQHIKNGGEAFYLEGEYIIWNNKGNIKKLSNVKEFPFTHESYSKETVLNIMAAVASVLTVCNNVEEITNILKNFHCDLYFNPERQYIV